MEGPCYIGCVHEDIISACSLLYMAGIMNPLVEVSLAMKTIACMHSVVHSITPSPNGSNYSQGVIFFIFLLLFSFWIQGVIYVAKKLPYIPVCLLVYHDLWLCCMGYKVIVVECYNVFNYHTIKLQRWEIFIEAYIHFIIFKAFVRQYE